MTFKPELREGLLLLSFLLATLLLLTRAQFQRSDGYIEYRVARRIITDRAVDLPDYPAARDHRVQPGRDGRLYSQFGLGQSVLYLPTIAVDRLVVAKLRLTRYQGVRLNEPFFFSISANALVLAMTGLCLFGLFRDFGISRHTGMLAVMLYVFGTMALVYSQLSFDMPLSVLSTLATFLFLFRATDRGKIVDWWVAGLCFGFSLLTRPNNAIFLLPAVLYILSCLPAGFPRVRPWLRGALVFSIGWLTFVPPILYYNLHRYGSWLDAAYNRPDFPFGFDSSLLESVPALLLSPGRSLVAFALPVLFSVPGLARFARHDYRKASALLLAAAINLLLFAKWSFWQTPYTWGPRFQLLVVTLLMVPLAFWIDAHRPKLFGSFKWITWPTVALCVAVQMVAALTGFRPVGDETATYWGIAENQILAAARNFANVIGRGDWGAAGSWWLTPVGQSPGMRVLLLALLATSIASAVGLWRGRERWDDWRFVGHQVGDGTTTTTVP